MSTARGARQIEVHVTFGDVDRGSILIGCSVFYLVGPSFRVEI